jgi:hypothetical protein
MTMRCIALCVCVSMLSAACSSSTPGSPSTPAVTTLRGSVTDPVGDTRPTSANPPDLVSATIEVASGVVTLTVGFTAGTVSPSDVYIVGILDTDQNPATGYPGVTSGGTDANLIGGDYLVYIPSAPGSTTAAIARATSATAIAIVGTTPLTFSSTQAQLRFALSLLGGTDGHMKFKFVSSQFLNGGANTTGVADIMPDAGLAPGVVQ